jgi:hypothetical protein
VTQFLVQLLAVPRDDSFTRRIAVVQLRDDGRVLPFAAATVDDLPLMAVDVMVDEEPGMRGF